MRELLPSQVRPPDIVGSPEDQGQPQPEAGEEGLALETQAPPSEGSPEVPLSGVEKPPGVFPTLRWWINCLRQPRTVAVTVEDGFARIVVIKGREVVGWRTAAMPEAPISANDRGDAGEGRPPLDLQATLPELRIPRRRLVTGLPLLQSTTRWLELAEMKKRYMREVVAAEALRRFPFTADEVDIGWQSFKSGTRHLVFTAAVRKEEIDEHVRIFKSAGGRPAATFPWQVALAHASGLDNAIVVWTRPSQAEAVLVLDYLPQAVHRADLPADRSDVQETAKALAKTIEALARHRQAADKPQESLEVPVVLAGDCVQDAQLIAALQDIAHYDVRSIQSPLMDREDFPVGEYAVNVGLALANESARKRTFERTATQPPAVSVLPARHLPRPFPLKLVAMGSAFLLLLALGSLMVPHVAAAATQAATLEGYVELLRRQERQQTLTLRQAQASQEQLLEVNQMVVALEARLADIQNEIATEMRRQEVVAFQARPAAVQLTTMAKRPDGFLLAGTAAQYEEVLWYADNLRASNLFTQVAILQMQGSQGPPAQGGPQSEEDARVRFQIKALTAQSPPP